jgi:hypothetical protein
MSPMACAGASVRLGQAVLVTVDDPHLPLALDNALKRMPMFAGKVHHLRRLCLSHCVRINPTLGNSFIMNAKHEMHCTCQKHATNL